MDKESIKDVLIENLLQTYSDFCDCRIDIEKETKTIIFGNEKYEILREDYLIIRTIIKCIKEASFIEGKDAKCLQV